jgi:hypothetical protein
MRLPRVRIWMMMVAVAFVAMAIYVRILWKRRAEFLERADGLAKHQRIALKAAEIYRAVPQKLRKLDAELLTTWRERADELEATEGKSAEWKNLTETIEKFAVFSTCRVGLHEREYDSHVLIAKHWTQLRRRYERAARYPWVSIPPHPPEPPQFYASLHRSECPDVFPPPPPTWFVPTSSIDDAFLGASELRAKRSEGTGVRQFEPWLPGRSGNGTIGTWRFP